MANRSDDKKKVRCSFCNKSQEQVRKLIAGPNVYICDECIEICSEIIQDEFDNEPSDSEINLLKPKEIKEFMDHRSPESLMELFEKEDKKITEQIKRLKYQQQFIRGRKEKMKGIWSIDFEHVFRKQFPNRYYIYEEIRDETDAGILKKTNEFITEFERRNYQMDYEIGYIQNENDILSGVYDNYTNAVILPFKKPKGMDYQILKAGEYLTGYHKGHWNTIGAAYERLLEYARCRQIKIDHIFLETYAVNNLMAESIEDYVTEIGVRIIS